MPVRVFIKLVSIKLIAFSIVVLVTIALLKECLIRCCSWSINMSLLRSESTKTKDQKPKTRSVHSSLSAVSGFTRDALRAGT